jgi:hypothetical protein
MSGISHQLFVRSAAALALLSFAFSAQAIVSTTASTLTSGLGVDYLDGLAKITLTRSDGTFMCSGSLLAGGAYVLTAAHCVTGSDGTESTSKMTISLDGGSVKTTATTYFVASGWDGNMDAGNDLALIQLSSVVTEVDGYALYSSSAQGSSVTVAGYGLTGTGSSGSSGTAGSLYYGYNQYDADSRFYQMVGASSGIYLYDFDSGTRQSSAFGSFGLGDSEVIIASGDSGGASLIYSDGTWYVAGVHSFIACFQPSCTADSGFGDFAGDVSVYGQMTWLQSYLVTAAVPEPQTYAMFLTGLGLLFRVASRRKCAV